MYVRKFLKRDLRHWKIHFILSSKKKMPKCFEITIRESVCSCLLPSTFRYLGGKNYNDIGA